MMVRLCVLVAIMVILMPGEWATEARSPFFLGFHPSPSQHVYSPYLHHERNNKLAGLRRRQDAVLRCDVVAPSGTHFVWYKNLNILHRQGAPQQELIHSQTQQETLEEQTNMVEQEDSDLVYDASSTSTSTSSSLLHYSSNVYIDCADEHDAAEYSLVVTTPSNNVHYRNFSIFLAERSQDGPNCLAASQMSFRPRIYQHSLMALAELGSSLILPCRAQGLHTAHAWQLNNTLLTWDHSNYMMLANGDLLIHQVEQGSLGRYTCRVTSTRIENVDDLIFTTVYPRALTL
ncbi:Zwei Ig domain protein zig-5-like [Homarus americanus]|uniref:Zwei Ig domain protein zig-5-like n=1 Tax=Homarus americanus TaxID=6706 RepID=A0A8J5ND42_HOMAM|nr:Zwei Ig domain protein zig-5-like [Homarus americanus]